MDDPSLLRELHFLGVDQHTWPVLALLPLIQVAWADGEVQSAERALILEVAERDYALDARGRQALMNWLTHPPTEQYLRRGRDAVRLLAERDPELANADTVLGHAEAVARAAGGLFGFRTVDAREQVVLDELVEAFSVPPETRWDWTAALDEPEEDAIEVIEMEEADFLAEHIDAPTIQCTFQPAEAPEVGAAELHRLNADGQIYALPPGGLSIGRARTSDLWVRDDAKVSRRHCQLYADADGQIVVEDHGSTTGTFVNGERVLTRPLFGGEEIGVGELLFRFVPPTA